MGQLTSPLQWTIPALQSFDLSVAVGDSSCGVDDSSRAVDDPTDEISDSSDEIDVLRR